MKLENQVVSLDLAKRLKELGVKQESSFYWILYTKKKTGEQVWELNSSGLRQSNWALLTGIRHSGVSWKEDWYGQFSAFTVAELGEMLPQDESFRIKHTTDEWNIWRDDEVFGGNTEADARAKMLIYLLENKLVSAP